MQRALDSFLGITLAKIVLAETDLDALFAVICLMRDMPVQTRHDAEALRARPGILKRNGSAGEAPGKAPDYPGKDGSFRAQIAALRLALGRWEARGEVPPSIAPTLIQLTLSAAQTEAFEKAFLAVFCYHFGAEYAERFGHLVERAVKLGVYPLPMKAEQPIDRTSVRPVATDGMEVGLASNPEPEAVEAAPIVLARGRTIATVPLSPSSRLARKARLGLQTSAPPPVPDGQWRPFGGLRR